MTINSQRAVEVLTRVRNMGWEGREIPGALDHAIATIERERWRPIAEAPKDRPVIVTNGEAAGEAQYHESDGGWWWAGYHPTDAADGYVWQPTHWRPLPDPQPDGQEG